MNGIEETETFNGLIGFCNFCKINVDPHRKLAHIRDDKHRELAVDRVHCFEDRLLYLKGDLLSQSEEEFSATKDVILTCEKTLKLVSDELFRNAEEKVKKLKDKGEDSDDDDDDDTSSNDSDEDNTVPKRILRGVTRTGSLSNGLLMRGEREVTLVVLSEEKPTLELLTDLKERFEKTIMVVSSTKKFSVELKDDKSCFQVQSEDETSITCKIYVTSINCRLHPYKPFNDKLTPDPPNMLSRLKCEEMLRMTRRSRWFEATCYSHRHSEVTIKILRDFCKREESFDGMDDWLLQVIFHKIIFSPNSQLDIFGIFQRFFECLSSGILLPDGPGLYDPCEREPCDLRDRLSLKQKLNITTTAQRTLRKMVVKHLPSILDLSPEEVELCSKKSQKRNNSDDDYHSESSQDKRRKEDTVEDRPMK